MKQKFRDFVDLFSEDDIRFKLKFLSAVCGTLQIGFIFACNGYRNALWPPTKHFVLEGLGIALNLFLSLQIWLSLKVIAHTIGGFFELQKGIYISSCVCWLLLIGYILSIYLFDDRYELKRERERLRIEEEQKKILELRKLNQMKRQQELVNKGKDKDNSPQPTKKIPKLRKSTL